MLREIWGGGMQGRKFSELMQQNSIFLAPVKFLFESLADLQAMGQSEPGLLL